MKRRLPKRQLRAIHAKNHAKSSIQSTDANPTLETTGRLVRYANQMKRSYEDKVTKKIELGAYLGTENLMPKAGVYGKVTFIK